MLNNTHRDIGFRKYLSEFCSKKDFLQNSQNVHTPFGLVDEMCGKLYEFIDVTDKTILTINLEFVEVLCYNPKIKKENVWFVTDCQQKANILKHPRYSGVNVVCTDFLTWNGNDMKFDVIVGNPPYNPTKNFTTGPNQNIWPDFVKKSLSLLKDDGYLCMVHPSSWRKPEHEMWPILSSKQIRYLSMYKKGEIFDGAVARVDRYILQNKQYTRPTEVNDQDENSASIDFRNIKFLPSGMMEDVSKIIGNENLCEVICNSSYHSQREYMNEKNIKSFIYPCIHSITSDGLRVIFSNKNDNGHFGIKKVIINRGDVLYPYNDYAGEYGMTENSFGIVIESKEEGDMIVNSINTAKFKEIVKSTKWGTNGMVEWRMFKYFKKDFWKEFI